MVNKRRRNIWLTRAQKEWSRAHIQNLSRTIEEYLQYYLDQAPQPALTKWKRPPGDYVQTSLYLPEYLLIEADKCRVNLSDFSAKVISSIRDYQSMSQYGLEDDLVYIQ